MVSLAIAASLLTACSASQVQAFFCTPAVNSNATGTAAGNASLLQAIKQDTVGNNKLTASMDFGADIESGFNPSSVGLGGGYGAFQIQEPGIVHPDISQSQALDAAYATNYMLPVYENALRNVDPSLWLTNPMLAMEDVAISAEKPQYRYDDYASNGRNPNTVPNAYAAALSYMQQQGVSTSFSDATLVNNTNVTGNASAAPLSNGNCNIASLTAQTGATGSRNTVLQAAYSQLGVSYSFAAGNAQGPTLGICTNDAGFNDCHIVGFDCSGLTLWAFAKVGITFPHFAATQWDMTKAYLTASNGSDLSKAKPGDLVFFTGSDGSFGAPGHVGIYIGDGKMINAPQSGENIQVTNIMTSFWQSEFVGMTDPFAYAAAQTH